MGCAVSIVHSWRASQGSSGRPMLVAKSLAVPMGTTAMDRFFGAFSLTRALATCEAVFVVVRTQQGEWSACACQSVLAVHFQKHKGKLY